MWLALSGKIYSRIALCFALNRIFFSANENGAVKQNNQSDFKASLNLPTTLLENDRHKSLYLTKLVIKLSDFKIDLIKWQLNFGSRNFGLKSYLWLQIELVLHARWILKSRVSFQTKLHSTQFNCHYKLRSFFNVPVIALSGLIISVIPIL